MTGPGAEMPFLEHLEELRVRLVRVLLALVAGFGVGLFLVQRFEIVNLLKAPIAPYLKVTGGKLVAQSPTEPVMITLKLALVLGLILSSPVLIYQIWGFFSPALYAKEKKVVVPTLIFGLVLFCAGAVFAFVFLLPQSLPILLGFQTEGIEILITFDNYFNFVVQLVVAMGICFEIPLVMIMLGALGILSAGTLNRFRRYAIVLAAIAGAILSPGTDVLSMIMMMVPILILYEIGFVGVWLVTRRQRKQAMTAAVILMAALAGWAGRAEAQVPSRPIPRDSLRRAAGDTTRPDSLRRPSQAVDTGAARRLGLPTAPRYQFAPDDSVITALLARPGYQSTRFRSDSATIFAQDRHLILMDKAMTRRGLTTLEGDSIAYTEADCLIRSRGSPALFDKETVLAGFGGIRYNTCLRRGIVTDALTSFKQEGTDWFLKGNLAQDSSSSRLFASKGEITSCDLPTPHYHFSAREVKWISRTVMVARPAVLYIRDVPILWLPFVFQDARPGRRSGILIPRFGLNDIVRQNPGYNRQITNIGYYWAPNDYVDMVAKLDWYANRYVSYGASGQYRLLSRDLAGGLGYSRLVENTGRRATNLRWDHRQNFDLSTSLNLSINYNSSSSTTQRNSLDPALSTQQITSSANFTKRYPWGTVAIGGNRRQSITDNSVSTQFPSLSITPKPLDLGRNVTWSPGFSLANSFETNFPGTAAFRVGPGGVLDTVAQTVDRRNTTINFDTPLRFGGFTWRNGFAYNDRKVDGRQVIASRKIPDESTPDPTDSITVSQVTTGDFSSDLDWQTGINLPPLFSSTWKLQPSLNIVNSTSGAFFLRNRSTNGDWVRQGKRLNFAISATPTFFGFFPGFGPIARIRHAISPSVSYSYSPSASIPADYARALAGPNGTPVFRSIQSQLISVGLTQNFEAKAKPRPGDTTSVENARKFRLLGITTTSIQYDFERAKEPGKTGWLTDNLGNTFQSDLLPNFSLSLSHDLFRGPVGTDSAKFSPFLQSVSARVSLSGRTFRSLLGIVGIGHGPDTTSAGRQERVQGYDASQDRFGRRRNNFYGYGGDEQIAAGGNRSFTASFDYSVQRTRREAGQSAIAPRKNLGFSTNFSPTAFWSVRYSTQYNVTRSEFESHTLDLERVLHEWRARFSFTRSPNGNFQFIFSVYLSDLQDIKFDYNQSSIER